MAMQSHHLHTHGPQPLYKQITAEEYEALKNENHALKQANKNLEERVTELEHQLARFTWYRMDEKPTPDVDEYVICFGGDDWNGRGYSMLKIKTMKGPFGCPLWTDGSGKTICVDEITHWMYLPPPPKDQEEKERVAAKNLIIADTSFILKSLKNAKDQLAAQKYVTPGIF